MPRLKLILNPAADRGHAGELEPTLHDIIQERVTAAGAAYDVHWVRTERPRHAIELAKDPSYDIVVAVGGDGTVHEVVNGLMQLDPSERPHLGVIPVGSGNDFAYNLGLPVEPHEAARCLVGDQVRTIDVGEITDDKGRHEFWDNTIGVGFSGAVNIASRAKKKLRGFAVYFVSVLETILFKPPDLDSTFEIDDKSFPRRISMVSICNGPREGGGFPVAPNASLDDGLLTYTIMRRLSRPAILRFLPVVMAGNHLKYTRTFDNGTAEYIRMAATSTMAIHVDGETFGPWEADIREIAVSIIPGALNVICSCD